MAKDPRREPTSPPEIVTGVRRTSVLRKLETLSPMPSIPPKDEPHDVLKFMLAVAQVHREDSAYVQARAEESREEIKAELDAVQAAIIKLDARQDRLEDRLNSVINAQIVQGSQITRLEKKQDETQEIAEKALSGFDARLHATNRRVDSVEKRLQQLHELVLADVDVRRKQLALDEVRNGAPETPKIERDDSGDSEG